MQPSLFRLRLGLAGIVLTGGGRECGAPGALPAQCCHWACAGSLLQDAPDYHLSRGRGQGRLRRCEGVLWTFKHRKISKSRKPALLGHLARSGPRRAHRLASTLPAVARATVVCFLRCECLRGRDVGRPRDPSRRWGARCSPGRDKPCLKTERPCASAAPAGSP